MDKNKVNNLLIKRRQARVRAIVSGTAERPRLSVFRSNRGLFVQLIDDLAGKTLLSISSLGSQTKGDKVSQAKELGLSLAKQAQALKITTVVFDRGSNKYHGRVKALAEGAREGGLIF
ncbi:MAG: 50S ribosomal protein L18 [Patescibacteria group bacterium]|jgi:large subunit ribosomal protein L18